MKKLVTILASFAMISLCSAMQNNTKIITVNTDNIHELNDDIKTILNAIDPIYLPENQDSAKELLMQECNNKTRQVVVMVDEDNQYLAHLFFVIQSNGHIRIAAPGYKDKSLAAFFLQKALVLIKSEQNIDGIQKKIICTYPQNHSVEVDSLLKVFNFFPDDNVEDPGYRDLCLNVYKYPADHVANVQFYSQKYPA